MCPRCIHVNKYTFFQSWVLAVEHTARVTAIFRGMGRLVLSSLHRCPKWLENSVILEYNTIFFLIEDMIA